MMNFSRQQIINYVHLMRLHKPIGILLLLWPTLSALWIAAQGFPPIHLVIIFIFGTVIMRTTGCIINDMTDHDVDFAVKRTKYRPLAQRTVSIKEAMIILISLMISAGILLFWLNPLCWLLALIAVVITIIYPWMKRVTHWPQLILGFAFSWGILMAFAAVDNQIPRLAWLFFLATFIWIIIYDTQYAMADREDDLKIGVKSTAILFGNYDRAIIGVLQIVFLLLLIIYGFLQQMHFFYFLGLIIAAMFFVYQQRLIQTRCPNLCIKAFLNNQMVGFSIFAGIFLNYVF